MAVLSQGYLHTIIMNFPDRENFVKNNNQESMNIKKDIDHAGNKCFNDKK